MNRLFRESDKIKETNEFYLLKGDGIISDRILSAVCSIISTLSLFGEDKPIIAITEAEEGNLKVSARVSEELAQKGLKLGEILGKAASMVSGFGGGHEVAAGAIIPKEKEAEFLKVLAKIIKERI
jgi:RecJ-like exonuclease